MARPEQYLECDPGDGCDHGCDEYEVPLFQVDPPLRALENGLGGGHEPLEVGDEREDPALVPSCTRSGH